MLLALETGPTIPIILPARCEVTSTQCSGIRNFPNCLLVDIWRYFFVSVALETSPTIPSSPEDTFDVTSSQLAGVRNFPDELFVTGACVVALLAVAATSSSLPFSAMRYFFSLETGPTIPSIPPDRFKVSSSQPSGIRNLLDCLFVDASADVPLFAVTAPFDPLWEEFPPPARVFGTLPSCGPIDRIVA